MGDEFLNVIDADEAQRRFREAVRPAPLPAEELPLDTALGRILAKDVVAGHDVPGFDRANVDGFALRAEDTFGAEEGAPRKLRLNPEQLSPGVVPRTEVCAGTATRIATGAMLPRGADAAVMVEHTLTEEEDTVLVHKPATPGQHLSFAGSDIARGEIVVRHGTRLTARDTGTLAAIGASRVTVHRRPRVAVFSTGNEIIAPEDPMAPGLIFDSNLRIISDTLLEMGCEPVDLGVVADDPEALRARIQQGLEHDAVILSGGTSKGEGDHAAAVLREMGEIVAHGVAVKPGKPICLAHVNRTPVVVLPGFPTSAVFTFHEFVAPILLHMAGAPPARAGTVSARVPMRLNTARGRAEFLLVSLLDGKDGPVAYPMGKGSGSVTAFARADGFIRLDRQEEYLEADEVVSVRLLGREVRPADLVVIGSHCLGLDLLLSLLMREGFTAKALSVGSQGGVLAAQRGECDVAGVHLCDEDGNYNTPFVPEGVTLVPGYGRMQGVIYRDTEPALLGARMINRNRGSGTRVLIDELLGDARPPGYHLEARSHNAVAAAIAQERADWGVAIRTVADMYGLGFRPLREERYDFMVPDARRDRPPVQAFMEVLTGAAARDGLSDLGFLP